jgi:type IV secretory pathway VirB10-like protein
MGGLFWLTIFVISGISTIYYKIEEAEEERQKKAQALQEVIEAPIEQETKSVSKVEKAKPKEKAKANKKEKKEPAAVLAPIIEEKAPVQIPTETLNTEQSVSGKKKHLNKKQRQARRKQVALLNGEEVAVEAPRLDASPEASRRDLTQEEKDQGWTMVN